jgi:threonine dehydrogenase-like Zn-dependent dehydrogenase
VLDDVSEPQVREPTDAIVRLTASAICGTDLHFVRGTVPGMEPGTILGHEGVGIVEEVGPEVRNLRPGDRVVIPSTIACGTCSYSRAGYYSQCDRANPNGPHAGTAFYGGPKNTGPFDGMQAELVRVPFANVGPVKLPDEVSDDQAIMLSDIFPTGWFGARLAEIGKGDVVAVFGCGPVGQFAILSAMLQGAGRILAVDRVASRLDAAKRLGAEVVDFGIEDPVQTISELTLGIGVDRVIDAVGVDAEPASEDGRPGDAPQQALEWEVATVAKAGTIGIIGVYPQQLEQFPIGQAMNKNLTVKMGNCNYRRYLPELVTMVRSGAVDPSNVLTQVKEASAAIDAYQAFDRHEEGWIKVELRPGS